MTTNRPKIFEHLSALGFTDYEIKAYVTLLTHGASNGYQLAKLSGIPRPNIYAVLERLVERGAVVGSAGSDTSEYQALPAEEMLNRLSHSFQSDVAGAKAALKKLDGDAGAPLAWNLKGYSTIVEKAERMIASAESHIYLALWPEEAARLSNALKDALKHGVKPTVLCLFGCEQECGGCHGKIYRYPMASNSEKRTLLLTTDGRETLIGQVDGGGAAVAAHSSNETLTTVATQYVRNAIAVAEIVRSLGPELLKIVDAEAMAALKGTGLSLNDQSWFESVFSIVNKKPVEGKKKK